MIRSPPPPTCRFHLHELLRPIHNHLKGVSRLALLAIAAAAAVKLNNNNTNRIWERRQLMEALSALHRPILPATQALLEGKRLHDLIIRHGFDLELFLVNNLLSIYATCGLLAEACHLFNRIPKKNVVSWTTMIAGHAQHGHGKKAFDLFHDMQKDGVKPNQVTFVSLLSACCNPDFHCRGNFVHFLVVENGLESHVIVGTALVRMYCNCSTLENAYHVFNNLLVRDVVSWTIMIAAYVKHEHGHEAMDLFGQMQHEGMMPNHYTYNIIINACATIPSLDEGQKVHARIVRTQYQYCLYVGNALLDMYAKCGSLEIAHKLFMQLPKRDLVSWNAMITAFTQHGNFKEVFKYFKKLNLEGFKPDQFTYSCILSVCTSLKDLSLGKDIHEQIRKAGLESELAVVNALLDMYAKCGCMEEAHKLFDKMGTRDEVSWMAMITGCVRHRPDKEALEFFDHMPRRDVFSWTAMIQGYVQHGNHSQALEFFVQMQVEGIRPNHITFGTVIGACAGLLDIEKGREVHVNIVKEGYQSDVNVGNALVDMYSRCGSLSDAHRVFDGMPKRDAVSWNVMIGGYAEHGNGKEAFEVFQQMQSAGIKPDEFTFSSILSACRHAGLVGEACHYFNHMLGSNGITPSVHHYASIIDLLGRAGCLHEAEDFINRIPFQPNIVVLMSLLSACKSHADTDLAGRFSDHMLKLEPTNAAAHVLLSNIFAGTGTFIDQEEGSYVMQHIV